MPRCIHRGQGPFVVRARCELAFLRTTSRLTAKGTTIPRTRDHWATRRGHIQCGSLICWAHEAKTDDENSAYQFSSFLACFSFAKETKHHGLPFTFYDLLFVIPGTACRARPN